MAPNQQQQHSSEVDLVTEGYAWKSKGSKNHQLDECEFCGRKHEQRRGKCPAYGQTCSSCWKPKRFAVKCKSRTSDFKRPSQKSKQKSKRSISSLPVMTPAIRPKKKIILSVSAKNAANALEMTDCKTKIFAHMELAGALVKMQVDSWALCNALSHALPKDSVINRANVKLTTYVLQG